MFSDKELDTKVKYKLGIFDGREPSESDLNKITDIFLSNLNARGEKTNTDISEIVRLKNLKSLDLKGFDLTPEVLSLIGSLKGLTGIKFYECESCEPVSIDKSQLKTMILDACSVQFEGDIDTLESLLVINGGVVDASRLPLGKKLRDLGIKNSEIVNSKEFSRIESLKSLNIDGSSIDDNEVLKILLDKKVAVSHEYEYHPIK